MLEVLFYLVILFAGFPAGLILAKLCSDEVKNWRVRFFLLSVLCFILILILSFIKFEYKLPSIISLLFIIITSLTITWRGYNK
jgi:hypothetical protein